MRRALLAGGASLAVAAGAYAYAVLPPALCHARGALPDPACTPGTIDPRVTEQTIFETICRAGYTRTVRPPTSYTNKLKAEQMQDYGLAGPGSLYEEDHLIPLELGGHPTDPLNLWPQPWLSGARKKDVVENKLHFRVCAGQLSLADAQRQIAEDWTKVQ